MIDCGCHGKRVAAVVCRHMVKTKEKVVGFVENNSDPNDLQAWCDACEAMYLREQELTPAFKEFNDMAIVCIVCYQQLKIQHSHIPKSE